MLTSFSSALRQGSARTATTSTASTTTTTTTTTTSATSATNTPSPSPLPSPSPSVPLRGMAQAAAAAAARAIRQSQFGAAPSVFTMAETKLASPAAAEVSVRMLAAPVHSYDMDAARGVSSSAEPVAFPMTPGSEGVGEVTAVGASVKHVAAGDRVVVAGSCWASELVVPETRVHKVDAALPVEYASVMSIGPCTAHRLLSDFAELREGDVIVQNGANGLVGQCVAQMAWARGVKVISVIRERSDQAEIVERLKAWGSFMVVTPSFMRTAEFRALLADLPAPRLALNCVGGESALEMARVLGKFRFNWKESPTFVTYGGAANQPVMFPSSLFVANNVRAVGFSLRRWLETASADESAEMLRAVESMMLARASSPKKGGLRVWIERHAFSNYEQAMARAAEGKISRTVVMDFSK